MDFLIAKSAESAGKDACIENPSPEQSDHLI